MVGSCCVPTCGSGFRNNNGKIKFHRFPHKDPELLQKWIKVVFDKTGAASDEFSRICSLHFTDADYYKMGMEKKLKENAVPSKFGSGETGKSGSQVLKMFAKEELEEIISQNNILDNTLKSNDASIISRTKIAVPVIKSGRSLVIDKNKKILKMDNHNQNIVPYNVALSTVIDKNKKIVKIGNCNQNIIPENQDLILEPNKVYSLPANMQNLFKSKCAPVVPNQMFTHRMIIVQPSTTETNKTVTTNASNNQPTHTTCKKSSSSFPSQVKSTTARFRPINNTAPKRPFGYYKKITKGVQTPHFATPKEAEYRKKIKLLQRKLMRCQSSVQKLKNEMADKKKQSEELNVPKNVLKYLRDNLDDFQSDFLIALLKNKKAAKNGERYTELVKAFSMTIYMHSPAAYEFVRKCFRLPRLRTLSKWMSSIDDETFEKFRRRVFVPEGEDEKDVESPASDSGNFELVSVDDFELDTENPIELEGGESLMDQDNGESESSFGCN